MKISVNIKGASYCAELSSPIDISITTNQDSSSVTETNILSTTSSPNDSISHRKSSLNRYALTEEEEAALEAEEEGDDFV